MTRRNNLIAQVLSKSYTLYFILGLADQRNQYLPVMEALFKLMETNRLSTQDVQNLLDVTKNLLKENPK